MERLSNSKLTIEVSALGAELSSIISNNNGREHLWQGDPLYWKRSSPVLFPIVGALWENKYKYNGVNHNLSQHGFARDMEFELISSTSDKLLYRLRHNEKTLKVYPFMFTLEIGYRLDGNSIIVLWRVLNNGAYNIYFQIGAHPAFYYPEFNESEDEQGFISFGGSEKIDYTLIEDKGCIGNCRHALMLNDGLLPLSKSTFNKDALIFEGNGIDRIGLLDKEHNPYITLRFSAPVVAIWSPPEKNAPFVCIEPWYGRTDSVGYTGEFCDKDWIQSLAPRGVFETEYSIYIENA